MDVSHDGMVRVSTGVLGAATARIGAVGHRTGGGRLGEGEWQRCKRVRTVTA